MRYLLILCFFWICCSVEHEKADNFRVTSDTNKSQLGRKVDGYVTKIEATPYTSVEIRLSLLNYDFECVGYKYVTVNNLNDLNDQVEFCELVSDSIIDVQCVITEVY